MLYSTALYRFHKKYQLPACSGRCLIKFLENETKLGKGSKENKKASPTIEALSTICLCFKMIKDTVTRYKDKLGLSCAKLRTA